MHASEYIGGGLARDMSEEPGVYVAVVVECDHDPRYCDLDNGGECNDEPLGWGVLRHKADD